MTTFPDLSNLAFAYIHCEHIVRDAVPNALKRTPLYCFRTTTSVDSVPHAFLPPTPHPPQTEKYSKMAGATGGSRFHSAAALMALFLALTGLIAADATLESVATGGPLLMRRSLATDDECASEIAACEADTSCLACNTAFFAKYDECTSGSFSIPCEEFQGDFCCALADENEDCENDSAFTNVIGG